MTISINALPDSVYADRAFNYGDGCFTTMRCVNHIIMLWDYHWQRLQADTQALGISLAESDWQALLVELQTVQRNLQAGVIKVHVSRGQGGRGYATQGVSAPSVTITTHPLPELNSLPVTLGVASGFLASQPLLAGIKHSNRLEQILFKRQAELSGVDDVLCLDSAGYLLETTSANVFWRCGDTWYTPELDTAGVSGVCRQAILAMFVQTGQAYTVGKYCLDVLDTADAMFLCNAVRGIIPVQKIILGERIQSGPTTHDGTIHFTPTHCTSVQTALASFTAQL